MIKKYYSHGIEYFTKWKLLSPQQIKILASVNPNDNNFYSIHNYYPDGSKGCPAMYFDLDGENAEHDMLTIKANCEYWFGVTPEIWDSGNKGYHVILPYEVKHPKCEKIAKYICTQFANCKSLDESVYSTKRLWRIPNTYNPKGKRNKTLLYKYSGELNETYLKELVYQAEKHLEKIEKEKPCKTSFQPNSEWKKVVPPCIENILEVLPAQGTKHYCLVQVCRFFETNQVPLEQAIKEVVKFEHWKEYENDISSLFNRMYNNGTESTFGCRNNILEKHCQVWCKYFRGDK